MATAGTRCWRGSLTVSKVPAGVVAAGGVEATGAVLAELCVTEKACEQTNEAADQQADVSALPSPQAMMATRFCAVSKVHRHDFALRQKCVDMVLRRVKSASTRMLHRVKSRSTRFCTATWFLHCAKSASTRFCAVSKSRSTRFWTVSKVRRHADEMVQMSRKISCPRGRYFMAVRSEFWAESGRPAVAPRWLSMIRFRSSGKKKKRTEHSDRRHLYACCFVWKGPWMPQ